MKNVGITLIAVIAFGGLAMAGSFDDDKAPRKAIKQTHHKLNVRMVKPIDVHNIKRTKQLDVCPRMTDKQLKTK